jgi:hypothetical protein
MPLVSILHLCLQYLLEVRGVRRDLHGAIEPYMERQRHSHVDLQLYERIGDQTSRGPLADSSSSVERVVRLNISKSMNHGAAWSSRAHASMTPHRMPNTLLIDAECPVNVNRC